MQDDWGDHNSRGRLNRVAHGRFWGLALFHRWVMRSAGLSRWATQVRQLRKRLQSISKIRRQSDWLGEHSLWHHRLWWDRHGNVNHFPGIDPGGMYWSNLRLSRCQWPNNINSFLWRYPCLGSFLRHELGPRSGHGIILRDRLKKQGTRWRKETRRREVCKTQGRGGCWGSSRARAWKIRERAITQSLKWCHHWHIAWWRTTNRSKTFRWEAWLRQHICYQGGPRAWRLG